MTGDELIVEMQLLARMLFCNCVMSSFCVSLIWQVADKIYRVTKRGADEVSIHVAHDTLRQEICCSFGIFTLAILMRPICYVRHFNFPTQYQLQWFPISLSGTFCNFCLWPSFGKEMLIKPIVTLFFLIQPVPVLFLSSATYLLLSGTVGYWVRG